MKRFEISFVDEFAEDTTQICGLVAVHGEYLLLPLSTFEILDSYRITNAIDFISLCMLNRDFTKELGWTDAQADIVIDRLKEILDIPPPPALRPRGA